MVGAVAVGAGRWFGGPGGGFGGPGGGFGGRRRLAASVGVEPGRPRRPEAQRQAKGQDQEPQRQISTRRCRSCAARWAAGLAAGGKVGRAKGNAAEGGGGRTMAAERPANGRACRTAAVAWRWRWRWPRSRPQRQPGWRWPWNRGNRGNRKARAFRKIPLSWQRNEQRQMAQRSHERAAAECRVEPSPRSSIGAGRRDSSRFASARRHPGRRVPKRDAPHGDMVDKLQIDEAQYAMIREAITRGARPRESGEKVAGEMHEEGFSPGSIPNGGKRRPE